MSLVTQAILCLGNKQELLLINYMWSVELINLSSFQSDNLRVRTSHYESLIFTEFINAGTCQLMHTVLLITM